MKTIKCWMFAALLLGMLFMGCREKGRKDTARIEPNTFTDYTGVYLDDEGTDNNLIIVPDRAGGYHVNIGIFRLASFDDGYGKPTKDGLPFIATDPAGQSIGGIIVLYVDTAIVTFTDSRWRLLPNGEQFRYIRK